MSEKYLGEEGTQALIAKIKGFAEPRVLDTPMTIGGVSKTTVDAALNALNSVKAEQVTSMAVASSSNLGVVVQYLGADTASYKHGWFYECVSDGEVVPTYSWQAIAVSDSVSVDGSTIVKDQSTGEISAVTATTSTLGIVKGGEGTKIGAAGQVNVVNRLVVTDTMPAASVDLLNAVRLYIGADTGSLTCGGIYQCQSDGESPATYSWVLISSANVDLSAYETSFSGTKAEWEALSSVDKAKYQIVNFTDDTAEGGAIVVDEVTSGNLNAVTSNAVANHLVLDTIDLGEITVAANTNYTALLSDYNIDTHNKPWVAFMYNRSNWGEFILFGDGSNILILRNTTASSVTGIAVIAVLHYGA